jgi:CHAD domain-containing protein
MRVGAGIVIVTGEASRGLEDEAVRRRAYELSQAHDAGTDVENWLRAEHELAVAHDYDTVDRDLERSGITISRLPLEAGVVWRLSLPRGECVEEWEPGNAGLRLPDALARLVEGVVTGKPLVPGPPLPPEPGALRLRELLEEQRRALVAHDPGSRLGEDPENLHQQRVAARRTRAFLRATRGYLDPGWARTLTAPLAELGAATGPVRDLDVLLQYVREEVERLAAGELDGGRSLIALLERERELARGRLLTVLESELYQLLLARLRLPPRLAPGVEAVRLDRVARKEFRRLAKAVGRLGKHPDDAAVHALRIRLKRARYAAELAQPAGETGRRFADHAKALQTLLGEHQDAVVAEELLSSATVVDAQTAAAFVAGRLAERQTYRRRSVAERLPDAWKRLRRSGELLG